MAYQVLARKWRPQRFDDVVGQRGVTQTLRNAIATGRVAQSFIFAGPRGVGKTTTARILARALNCVQGPTPDPCGVCDACVEIAEGRDIDVLEIDAATHTQVDNVREVIIAGLGILPVRNRRKVFLIDEVHQLSNHSFNALLKSLEEPPPHVVFMMATTELGKIPETILSRSQVYEFRTIGAREIAAQLGTIAAAEGIQIDEAALALIARAADGSMRDAQSAFDQVIAFAGRTISTEDVSTVLGLVGRDLLLDIVDAVAAEEGAAIFDLAARAVEAGYDLRIVCRELSRLVRDLLVLTVDPSRAGDPEVAPEGERERLRALAARFSGEDLMRAFDVLTRTEQEVRFSGQPRYHLEMGLLRWLHLRKLLPLAEVIETLQRGGPLPPASRPGPAPATRAATGARPAAGAPPRPVRSEPAPSPRASVEPGPEPPRDEASPSSGAAPPGPIADPATLKDALLAEIKRVKRFVYGTVVSKARSIEIDGDRIVFTYAPSQAALRAQLEQLRPWLESVAGPLAGRRLAVVTAQGEAAAGPAGPAAAEGAEQERQAVLRAEALEDAAVQAMLDVFVADIREVEELEKDRRS
jgi:DNA polymerase III subunit gamma/tau